MTTQEEIKRAKQNIAERYDKRNWNDVLSDYAYEMGVSEVIGFEELMDMVTEEVLTNYIKL